MYYQGNGTNFTISTSITADTVTNIIGDMFNSVDGIFTTPLLTVQPTALVANDTVQPIISGTLLSISGKTATVTQTNIDNSQINDSAINAATISITSANIGK